MMSAAEIVANASYAASVWLAARNSAHTWWIGILGCVLFGWIFYSTQLYADVTLQVFFVITSLAGWWHWLRGSRGEQPPISRTPWRQSLLAVIAALLVAAAYGLLLHRFTSAYAPFLDSVVLTFSVLGQLLLMRRRLENWYAWLLVNTVAVPLYASRELYLTAGLYAAFWLNAWYGLYRWRRALAT